MNVKKFISFGPTDDIQTNKVKDINKIKEFILKVKKNED